MTRATSCRLGIWILLLVAGGCSGQRGGVAGKVTLDGAALETGSISFLPIEGTESPTAGAVITNGAYEIPRDKGPMPGIFRVEIRAQRKTGNKIPAGSPAPPGTLVDETVEAIPARYNKESTLRAEVKAGANPLNFELSTK